MPTFRPQKIKNDILEGQKYIRKCPLLFRPIDDYVNEIVFETVKQQGVHIVL